MHAEDKGIELHGAVGTIGDQLASLEGTASVPNH